MLFASHILCLSIKVRALMIRPTSRMLFCKEDSSPLMYAVKEEIKATRTKLNKVQVDGVRFPLSGRWQVIDRQENSVCDSGSVAMPIAR